MAKQHTFTHQQVKSWQDASFKGFLAWLQAMQPNIIGSNSRPIVFELQDFQKEFFEGALQVDIDNKYIYKTVIASMPRRHSKSHLSAFICLWRVFTQPNQNICIFANTEKQIISIGFKICRDIILASPLLLEQLGGKENIQTTKIINAKLNSTISTRTCNTSSLYGERIDLAWLSELHASPSDDVLQIVQSSQGDVRNALTIIDSTTDCSGGILDNLEKLSKKQDKTIFYYKLEYKNLDEALKLSPPWIDRPWLVSRSKQLLKAVFASQHLNQRGEASNNFFSRRSIEWAMDSRLPKVINNEQLQELACGRNYRIGAALDRALSFSQHGDRTVFSVACKIANADPLKEPDFYVLSQQHIKNSGAEEIKRAILDADKEYTINSMIIELYGSADIHYWCLGRGIPSELCNAHNTKQVPAFEFLHRLFVEKRIHFSKEMKELESELRSFVYDMSGSTMTFGSRKFKDDYIYSLLWSVFSLRDTEIASYSIDSVICDSKSVHAPLCFLRNDDCNSLILNCAQSCQTYHQVLQLYNQYCATNLSEDVSLQNFYKNLVVNSGMTAIL